MGKIREEKKKKPFVKRGLPKLTLKLQLPLYSVTLIACVLSSAGMETAVLPKYIRDVAARHFTLNCLSSNHRRRIFLFAIPGIGMNFVFTGFNAAIGIANGSAWYLSLAVYYGLLCLMRSCLLHCEFFNCGEKEEGTDRLREWKLYSR